MNGSVHITEGPIVERVVVLQREGKGTLLVCGTDGSDEAVAAAVLLHEEFVAGDGRLTHLLVDAASHSIRELRQVEIR